MNNDRWTRERAAQTALQLSGMNDGAGASNLGGVTNALHEIFRAFSSLGSTENANKSAPMQLLMDYSVWLSTGKHALDAAELTRIANECEKISRGEA